MGRSENEDTKGEQLEDGQAVELDAPLRKTPEQLADRLAELRARAPAHIEVSLTPAGGILRRVVAAPTAPTAPAGESLLARVARQLRLPIDPTKGE